MSKVTGVSQRRITSNDHLISGILLTVKITVQSPVECAGGYFTVESLRVFNKDCSLAVNFPECEQATRISDT